MTWFLIFHVPTATNVYSASTVIRWWLKWWAKHSPSYPLLSRWPHRRYHRNVYHSQSHTFWQGYISVSTTKEPWNIDLGKESTVDEVIDYIRVSYLCRDWSNRMCLKYNKTKILLKDTDVIVTFMLIHTGGAFKSSIQLTYLNVMPLSFIKICILPCNRSNFNPLQYFKTHI